MFWSCKFSKEHNVFILRLRTHLFNNIRTSILVIFNCNIFTCKFLRDQSKLCALVRKISLDVILLVIIKECIGWIAVAFYISCFITFSVYLIHYPIITINILEYTDPFKMHVTQEWIPFPHHSCFLRVNSSEKHFRPWNFEKTNYFNVNFCPKITVTNLGFHHTRNR